MASEEYIHPDLQSVFDNVGDILERNDKSVPLEPFIDDDPFFLAQLRQKELERLPNLEGVPVLHSKNSEAFPSKYKSIGAAAREEINRYIPPRLRKQRIAISTFFLTVLEVKSKTVTSYEDTGDGFLISGLFDQFDFDEDGNPKTLIVPLYHPLILKPRALRGIELDHVSIPVLSMKDWNIDLKVN